MKISWVHQKYLKRKLSMLEDRIGTTEGGGLLEEIVDLIFRYNGFRTLKTKTRTKYGDQIDLHVLWERPILIECKCHKSKARKSDIEKFKTRVSKRNPLTIGLFVSWSGFTKAAIDEIISSQERAIIVLTGEEIKAIIDNKLDLEYLLEIKLYYLQRGEVYIGTEVKKFLDLENFFNSELFDVKKYDVKYPSGLPFCDYQVHDSFHVAYPLLFALDNLDLEGKWYFVKFHIQDQNNSLILNPERFLELVEAYNRIFGFSELFTFGIGQNKVRWYGIGINNFLEAILFQPLRYNKLHPLKLSHPPLHDFESIVAMDYWYGDFLLLMFFDSYVYSLSNPELAPSIGIRHLEFKLGFRNFPYYRKRIDKFAELANLYFELYSTEIPSIHFPIFDQIKVKVLSYITDSNLIFSKSDKTWVIGAIIENPLKNKNIRNLFQMALDVTYTEKIVKILESYPDPSELNLFRRNFSKILSLLSNSLYYLSDLDRFIVYCKDYFTIDDPKELYLEEVSLYYLPNTIGLLPLLLEICVNW